MRDQLERGRGLRYMAQEIEGVFKLASLDKGRSRAFAVALDELLWPDAPDLDLRKAVVDATLAKRTDVPVIVAREGSTAIMAWLAAHGHDNTPIANALDVAESTVRVNLSKFKNE